MKSKYAFYTETKINNKWHCIDPKVTIFRSGRDERCTTYSVSDAELFRQAYEKIINELASKITYDGMSPEIKEIVKKTRGAACYAILPEKMALGINFHKPGMHGFVPKDEKFRFIYERGEITHCLSTDEYIWLPFEGRLAYEFFEWDDPKSWYTQYKQILNRYRMRVDDFLAVNGSVSQKTRLVLLVI